MRELKDCTTTWMTEWVILSYLLRNSSPKNENFIIIYSPPHVVPNLYEFRSTENKSYFEERR